MAGVLLAACAVPGAGSGSARGVAAKGIQVLPADQVQALTDPGVALTSPSDGRLRGYGFSAVVTGVASTHQAGGPGPSSTYVAPPGSHLVVFTATL